jgi:hypothetical protein
MEEPLMALFKKEINQQQTEEEILKERLKQISFDLKLAEQDEKLAQGDYIEVAIIRTNSLRTLRNMVYKEIKEFYKTKDEDKKVAVNY